MSASTASLLLDFADPVQAALELVKNERLSTELACVLNPSLSREEIENFYRVMWRLDQVSSVIDQYLELARSLPPPAMIYVETADGERAGIAGERLLDDARLVGVPGDLVLCIGGCNFSVVDVSRSPLPHNGGPGEPPNLGSSVSGRSPAPIHGGGWTRSSAAALRDGAQGDPPQTAQDASLQPAQPGFGMVATNTGWTPPSPELVLNPAFLRWRETAITWQRDRLKRVQRFLAAGDVLRRDWASYEINIEAHHTVSADEQAEPIDDRANRTGMSDASAPPKAVASYLARGNKIGGHEQVRGPYLSWLREQSGPVSYNKQLDKLKELALATGWLTSSGPVVSTLRSWEMKLRQEFLREANQPDRPLSA